MPTPRFLIWFRSCAFLAALALAPLGCTGESIDDSSDRGKIAKADLTGSCQGQDVSQNFCGGPSDGNCFCDSECETFGDCCSDKAAVCDSDAAICPDPNDPGVSYVDTDPLVCAAADFLCLDGEAAFDNDCGCGCVVDAVDVTCSVGDAPEDCCTFPVSKSGYWKMYTDDPDVCAHITFGQGGFVDYVDDDFFCQLQCPDGEIIVDMTPNLDDFRIGCAAGCEAQCPDPNDAKVHYIDDNPAVCVAADWACDADQTPFDDECGCGCIDL